MRGIIARGAQKGDADVQGSMPNQPFGGFSGQKVEKLGCATAFLV
jgi:hypothetical protein